MVKFSHTLFALPFAFAGAALAASRYGFSWEQAGWVVLAMVGARNAAMGFNRLVDRDIDARNPRTAGRELPSGKLAPLPVWLFTIALTALFVVATWQLGLLPWVVPAILVIFGYSYTKRVTWLCHFVLGLGLAMAPAGGWMAFGGGFDPIVVSLCAAVLTWVAGFDIIYACQDEGFDRDSGLHSIPSRFGIAASLTLARVLHAGTLGGMSAVGYFAELHPGYWAGIVFIAGLMVYEHRLVRPDDLSKLGVAFFNMNGVIAVVYFAAVLAGVLL